MPYEMQATAATPALIVYLIDLSKSMEMALEGRPRIDVVNDALDAAIDSMIARSTKGARIVPRYRVAIYGYSDEVMDVLEGVRTITEIAEEPPPRLITFRTTRTADAFLAAEQLIRSELHALQDCPAPLVCHLTDGIYTGDDPEPIVHRIRSISVADGPVLVENIFISDKVETFVPTDVTKWGGIMPGTRLETPYAEKLKAMSSVLPESYREMMAEYGCRLDAGALMMFPGTSADLVRLGFTASQATL